ncbi:MAG: hypothetical protein KIH69_019190 [Anaerolineae bacterium]|nr:hypothetical protein [Anaerolineae bacterium]
MYITQSILQLNGKVKTIFSAKILWAVLSILLNAIIIIIIVNPIWQKLDMHVPGEPQNLVDFRNPVDTIFYLRNAENGYNWHEPQSIWFHPLFSWLVQFLPHEIPLKWRGYLISIVSAILALTTANLYAKEIFEIRWNERLLFLSFLVPGGLNTAIGNVELLDLFFNTTTILLVLKKKGYYLAPFITSLLGILTKPNTLYLIAPLTIYLVYSINQKDSDLFRSIFFAMLGITLGWICWILYVDYQTGLMGSYWQARQVATVPLFAGPFSLMYRTIYAIQSNDINLILKFSSVFSVCIFDLWLVALLPFKRDIDKLASIFSIFSLLIISFLINNPNKVIVYALTIPIHIPAYLAMISLIIRQLTSQISFKRKLAICGLGFLCFIFCVLHIIFFVAGTPLEWYF